MPGGIYDMFEGQQAGHQSRIGNFAMSPYGIIGTIAGEMYGRHLLDGQGLLNAMSPKGAVRLGLAQPGSTPFGGINTTLSSRRILLNQARDGNFVPGAAGRLTGVTNRQLGVNRVNTSRMGAGAARYQQLSAGYGRGFANRLTLGRGVMGAARFVGYYAVLEAGIGVAKSLADSAVHYERPENRWRRRDLETGGGFVDTRFAKSQRERAIQAIHNTQLSTRAVLGNEAAFVHMR